MQIVRKKRDLPFPLPGNETDLCMSLFFSFYSAHNKKYTAAWYLARHDTDDSENLSCNARQAPAEYGYQPEMHPYDAVQKGKCSLLPFPPRRSVS